MKYMVSWNERPQGSPLKYENAQKRILEVFGQWKAPADYKIEFFVVRVGDWGGHMLVECDDPLTVHKFCSMLPAFIFEARPVVPVEERREAGLGPGSIRYEPDPGPAGQPHSFHRLSQLHNRLVSLPGNGNPS